MILCTEHFLRPPLRFLTVTRVVTTLKSAKLYTAHKGSLHTGSRQQEKKKKKTHGTSSV